MSTITIQKRSVNWADSYNRAVDTVARERLYLATVEGFPVEGSRSYVRFMEDHDLPQYFALDDGVVGWCDITPKSIPEFSHVGVLGMGILAAYRGQGLGRRLLEATLAHARGMGTLEKVELAVYASNTAAIALYERLGFEHEGVRRASRKLDGVFDSEVLMALFLTESTDQGRFSPERS